MNGHQHEQRGPKGAMCAPVQVCELRDARAEVGRLRERVAAWEAAVFTKIEQCATCDGDGFMEVMVRYNDHEGEVTEPEPCAECGGTGRGDIKAVMDILRADLAAAHVQLKPFEEE